MKKILTAALLTSSLLPMAATADTIFGVYAGGQYWHTNTSGSFADDSNLRRFNFDSEQQSSLYVAVEHPIPFIPNIKVRHNQLEVTGTATLDTGFSYAGQTWAPGTAVQTFIDLTHTDFTLYYEILDNDVVAFDVGVTAKRVDGLLAVSDGNLSGQLSSDGWVPTLYAHGRFGIPATDLTLFALANAVSIDDSRIRDMEAGVEYRLLDNLAINMNLQLGYRNITIELDDLDGIYSDLRFKGPYIGLEIHF